MGIFNNYTNLDENYIPDNVSPQYPNEVIEKTKLPKPSYNIKGDFVGYTWNLDDTFVWEIDFNRNINVEDDAIIYNVVDETPTINTVGCVGQKAYNTVAVRSWECLGNTNGEYIWKEDEKFTYPHISSKSVELTPIIKDTITLELYNFRWEHIDTFSHFSDNKLLVEIDNSINEVLSQGIYYAVVKSTDGTVSTTMNKYIIFVQ